MGKRGRGRPPGRRSILSTPFIPRWLFWLLAGAAAAGAVWLLLWGLGQPPPPPPILR